MEVRGSVSAARQGSFIRSDAVGLCAAVLLRLVWGKLPRRNAKDRKARLQPVRNIVLYQISLPLQQAGDRVAFTQIIGRTKVSFRRPPEEVCPLLQRVLCRLEGPRERVFHIANFRVGRPAHLFAGV